LIDLTFGEAVGEKKFSHVSGDVRKVVAEGNKLHYYIDDGPVSNVPRHEVLEFKSAKNMADTMRKLSDQHIPIEDADGNQISR
jgi:hypothetical protein